MSASMYNNPYTYKQPFPKIEYPPMFSGLSKCFSFKHVLDSKFLALGFLLLAIAAIITLICIVSPFWFKLVFSANQGTFGDEAEKRELTINSGVFFMNENEFDNLATLNKMSNQEVVPSALVIAQVLEVIGMCGLVACIAATAILMFRRFSSVTAYFMTAFFSSVTGLFLLLAFLCVMFMATASSCDPYSGDTCNYEDNLKWRVLPIYSQRFRVESLVTPFIKLNWTFYISIIGAALTIGGSVFLWLEAFSTYKNLCQIRYRQLRTARDPHEGDFNPQDHRKYVYQAPVMSGPMSYGMQPVVFQGGPYGAQPAPPPQPGYSVGFEQYEPRYETKRPSSSSSPPTRRRGSPPPMRRRSPSPPSRSPSPSPPTSRRRSPPPRRRSPSPPSRRGPPSMNSSMSEGPYISREIDL